MKKIIVNIFIITTLLFIVSQMLLNSEIIILAVKDSLNVWKNNLFPSLFPFFIISSLLINYGFVEIISEIFKPITKTLFKTSSNSSFIIFMSMISGIPSNAKYISELLDRNMITDKEANKLILFTQYSNPLFILGTIGTTLLKNNKLSFFILVSHYFSNIILGLLIRFVDTTTIDNNNSNIIYTTLKKNNNFGEIVSTALINSINTMLIILGIISFFNIIVTIVNNFFKFNILTSAIITSIFEMTQGLVLLSYTNINIKIKAILMCTIISFGGLSSHMQVMTILNKKKIRYTPYLIFRILHAIISGIIMYILINNYTF